MEKEEYIKQLKYKKWVPLLTDLNTYKLQVLAEKYKGLLDRHMINSLTEEIAKFVMWAMEREAMGIRSGRGTKWTSKT